MGNYNTRAVRFLQSINDFPCPVGLGKNTPSFGLYRFNQALRFVPPDDEGFTMWGNKQRLLYKGRRRSHRFTILGDTAFEYDCILEREPETNIISLVMDGAEHYDFFRQPDFLKNPFLAGSYAVYKKETLLGEGTGKLCHIHRPEIIDARGRRCWGDLSIVRNELHITIPERFLSEAVYPVIVDPTIGTTTVGSQNYYVDNESDLCIEISIAVNRFLVPETISGSCTANIYTNADDYYAAGRGVLYSDNADKPQNRKSINEQLVNLRVTGGNPAGWRSGTFQTNGSIASGSYIWFGVFTEDIWFPRFDYGAKCYIRDWDYYNYCIPETYNLYAPNLWEEFRLSMYFDYSAGQNYVRTLTQGVTLTDNRKLKIDYKRKTEQMVQAESQANIIWMVIAKITDTVNAAGGVFRGLVLLVRIVTGAFVRDYLFGRFLNAREELVLKSAVTTEIILDSRIG